MQILNLSTDSILCKDISNLEREASLSIVFIVHPCCFSNLYPYELVTFCASATPHQKEKGFLKLLLVVALVQPNSREA